MIGKSNPSFLLHGCCAPCITYPLQVLKDDFNVSVFFYNPNIHPKSEYFKRKREIKRLTEKWGFNIIVGSYDANMWFEAVKGYEEEPEGGLRCEICYRLRLERTAQEAKERNDKFFGTTLSISPHKKTEVINRIGGEISKNCGVEFYGADFKKNDGFKRSCQISREEDLYRQNYCGCVFSKR